jgi:hypothetical protein
MVLAMREDSQRAFPPKRRVAMSQKFSAPAYVSRPDISVQGASLTQQELKVPIAARRGKAGSARAFYNRQARTDAAIRTIPGLHNFGNG